MKIQITESQYQLIMELSPKSAGVQEFIQFVKDTPGLLKHLQFKTHKSLEEYLLDATYKEFNELKKEAKSFNINKR